MIIDLSSDTKRTNIVLNDMTRKVAYIKTQMQSVFNKIIFKNTKGEQTGNEHFSFYCMKVVKIGLFKITHINTTRAHPKKIVSEEIILHPIISYL